MTWKIVIITLLIVLSGCRSVDGVGVFKEPSFKQIVDLRLEGGVR